MKILKILAAVVMATLLLNSCSTEYKDRKAYTRVHNDPYRSSGERTLLADPCRIEFPFVPGPPVVTNTGVDSSSYYDALNAYNAMIDQYIVQKDSTIELLKIIAAGKDSAHQAQAIMDIINATRQRDSARVIRNFLIHYKPAPIIHYQDREVKVLDSATTNKLQSIVNACQVNEEVLQVKYDKAVPWQKRFWIAIGIFAVLIILLILYLINRKRP